MRKQHNICPHKQIDKKERERETKNIGSHHKNEALQATDISIKIAD